MQPTPQTPLWDVASLRRHHRKRTTKDAGCFEELLGVTGRTITEAEYEQRSRDAFANAWAEFEGEGGKASDHGYYEPAVYFVDDELVVVITDLARLRFTTCYHEHFDQSHSRSTSAGVSSGQRRLRFRDQLKNDERGKMIIKVRRIRGFSDE